MYFSWKEAAELSLTNECLKEVKTLFNTLIEWWYSDVELYHYVGYIVDQKIKTVEELYSCWYGQDGKIKIITPLSLLFPTLFPSIFLLFPAVNH